MTFLVLGSGNSSVTKNHCDSLKHLTCTAADSSSSENNDGSAAKHKEMQWGCCCKLPWKYNLGKDNVNIRNNWVNDETVQLNVLKLENDSELEGMRIRSQLCRGSTAVGVSESVAHDVGSHRLWPSAGIPDTIVHSLINTVVAAAMWTKYWRMERCGCEESE